MKGKKYRSRASTQREITRLRMMFNPQPGDYIGQYDALAGIFAARTAKKNSRYYWTTGSYWSILNNRLDAFITSVYRPEEWRDGWNLNEGVNPSEPRDNTHWHAIEVEYHQHYSGYRAFHAHAGDPWFDSATYHEWEFFNEGLKRHDRHLRTKHDKYIEANRAAKKRAVWAEIVRSARVLIPHDAPGEAMNYVMGADGQPVLPPSLGTPEATFTKFWNEIFDADEANPRRQIIDETDLGIGVMVTRFRGTPGAFYTTYLRTQDSDKNWHYSTEEFSLDLESARATHERRCNEIIENELSLEEEFVK